MSHLTPAVLDALAVIRAAVRTSRGQDLRTLYQMLLSLSLFALCESIPVSSEAMPLGHSAEPSQVERASQASAMKVPDRWIAAKEGAHRLGISMRTLRRRACKPPYCAFCIAQPRGFKISEVGLDDFMRRSRERAIR